MLKGTKVSHALNGAGEVTSTSPDGKFAVVRFYYSRKAFYRTAPVATLKVISEEHWAMLQGGNKAPEARKSPEAVAGLAGMPND